MLLVCFSTISAVISGCDDSVSFANAPPGGLKITRNKCYLGPRDVVSLNGQATDTDGDEISYSWTAESGTLSPADGKGQFVTWQAPAVHGTYVVKLSVTDGIDGVSKSIDIDVGRNIDMNPGINVITDTDYAYIVPGNIPFRIASHMTLRIEAGVKVVFCEGTGGFNVEGGLVINGTEQDMVLLAPSACPGESRVWNGIVFRGGQATGDLNYMTISSTADGLTVENEAVVTADNIVVDQASGEGVAVINGGRLTLSNSRVWDNGAGIYVANGTLLLQNSSIKDNGNFGISMIATGGPFNVTITSCVIATNVMEGIVLAEMANPSVNNCSLYWNGSGRPEHRALFLSPGYSNQNTIDMTGNYWGVTTELEIEQQIIMNEAEVMVDYSGWLEDPPVQ
jgi:hypothetical protein